MGWVSVSRRRRATHMYMHTRTSPEAASRIRVHMVGNCWVNIDRFPWGGSRECTCPPAPPGKNRGTRQGLCGGSYGRARSRKNPSRFPPLPPRRTLLRVKAQFTFTQHPLSRCPIHLCLERVKTETHPRHTVKTKHDRGRQSTRKERLGRHRVNRTRPLFPSPPSPASTQLFFTFEDGGEIPAEERMPCRKVAMATDSEAELETPPPRGTAPTTTAENSKRFPSGICAPSAGSV